MKQTRTNEDQCIPQFLFIIIISPQCLSRLSLNPNTKTIIITNGYLISDEKIV